MPCKFEMWKNPGFQSALLDWFRAAKRDLPWRRRQDDAYAIWISEVMLQQTTVAAAIGFYNRWMDRFPNVRNVADAEVDEVLRYWSGLGYYSRAHNIKRSADLIVSDHAGLFPDTAAKLAELPGIGRYTAGAIASIVFNQDVPALDVNVNRVITRLAAVDPAPDKSNVSVKTLAAIADDMIPKGNAGEFNQAIMELGALICTAREPRCDACHVRSFCVAALHGKQDLYPAPIQAKPWKTERHVSVAVQVGERLLLVKRPPGSVWAGLWEMPRVIARFDERLEDAAARAAFETSGLMVDVGEQFGSVQHVVMRSKIALTGFEGRIARPKSASACNYESAWVYPGELASYALSSPQTKLIRMWHEAREQNALEL